MGSMACILYERDLEIVSTTYLSLYICIYMCLHVYTYSPEAPSRICLDWRIRDFPVAGRSAVMLRMPAPLLVNP